MSIHVCTTHKTLKNEDRPQYSSEHTCLHRGRFGSHAKIDRWSDIPNINSKADLASGNCMLHNGQATSRFRGFLFDPKWASVEDCSAVAADEEDASPNSAKVFRFRIPGSSSRSSSHRIRFSRGDSRQTSSSTVNFSSSATMTSHKRSFSPLVLDRSCNALSTRGTSAGRTRSLAGPRFVTEPKSTL